jgi:hypothetical protein
MRSAQTTVLGEAGADPVLWLLEGDPAIRWQVLRDLVDDSAPEAIAAERKRVATEGWGARLLALQDRDGLWGSALYSPKWTSTTYTLLLLHWLGLPSDDARARAGCQRLWEGARYYGGGLTLAKTVREPETCITGMLVLLAARFGGDDGRLETTLAWLLDQQLRDGGWNCETIRSGSTHGSYHTTITALEALDAVDRASPAEGIHAAVTDAAARGREFLLAHRLYRSHRTGAVSDPALLRWRFPPQWHYDLLRGLDYFASIHPSSDPRLDDAIGVVRRARRPDGRWSHRSPYPGRMWFPLERPGPSRWHTLRALRVLRWHSSGTS